MGHYTCALRINAALGTPLDHVLYSNRAACYMQLGDYKIALADCRACVRAAPEYEKGWVRLVQCLEKRSVKSAKALRANADACAAAREQFPGNAVFAAGVPVAVADKENAQEQIRALSGLISSS